LLRYVVPFYNSEATLAPNVRALHSVLVRDFPGAFELVLCDDGSTDGSRGAAYGLAAELPAVRVVGYPENRGRGYAVRFAAASCEGERLIFSDLDLPRTTDLGLIRALAAALETVPVVVGSRFVAGSSARRQPVRGLVGRAHRLAVRVLLPALGVRDPDAGFKGFDLPWLKRASAVCREDRWSWDMEILAAARANGLPILEIPIDWNERHDAYATSVNLLGAAWEEFTGMRRIRRDLKRGLYRL
jgi:glycosyltransferase involved in cell wall biosynthesis